MILGLVKRIILLANLNLFCIKLGYTESLTHQNNNGVGRIQKLLNLTEKLRIPRNKNSGVGVSQSH
jgi:hypothetical protein